MQFYFLLSGAHGLGLETTKMTTLEKQLITVGRGNALTVFLNTDLLEDLLDDVRKQAQSLVADIETSEGRKDIAGFAYRVARTKTYLDGIGKELVAEYKEIPKRIDAGRKYARDCLDALKDEVRKPLDEWEIRQKKIEIGVAIFNCWDEAHAMNQAFIESKIAEAKAKEEARIACEQAIREKAIEEEKLRAKIEAERQEQAFQRRIEQEKQAAEEQLRLAKQRAAHQVQILIDKQKNDLALQEKANQELKAKHEKLISDENHRKTIQQDAIMSLGMIVGIDFAIAEMIVTAIDQKLIDNINIVY